MDRPFLFGAALTQQLWVLRFDTAESAERFRRQTLNRVLHDEGSHEFLVFGEMGDLGDEQLPAGCVVRTSARACRIGRGEDEQESYCRRGAEVWSFPFLTLAIFKQQDVLLSGRGITCQN